jgi:hypothetical protein
VPATVAVVAVTDDAEPVVAVGSENVVAETFAITVPHPYGPFEA